MGSFADIYVIKKTRSREVINEFLNHFLPNNEECVTCYEFPQYEKETIKVFSDVNELMKFLEENIKETYQIYWKNLDSESPNCFGMLFYTSDGCVIYGISRDTFVSNEINGEDRCLEEMKDYFKTNDGYITYESIPESIPETTYQSFIDTMNSL